MEDKTLGEVERAASLWFMCHEAFKRGETIPPTVFAIDVSELTPEELHEGLALAMGFGLKDAVTHLTDKK